MKTPVQVSTQFVAVYQVLASASGWLTNTEIAQQARVEPRTTRAHTACLASLGIVDKAEVFGGYRFRLRQSPALEALAHRARIEDAAKIMDKAAR